METMFGVGFIYETGSFGLIIFDLNFNFEYYMKSNEFVIYC
jgi:hypothetical protein